MDFTMRGMGDSFGQEWLRNWLPRLHFGGTLDQTIHRFASQEASASALTELLSANPLFENAVLSMVRERMHGRDASEKEISNSADRVVLSTHRCVELLGVLGTRNAVASLRQIRAMGDPWPYDFLATQEKKTKPEPNLSSGKVFDKAQTENWLKFSLKAQEFCQSHQIADPEGLGFTAGALYDWVKNLALRRCDKTQNIEKAAEEFYQRSLKLAFVAARLAEKAPGFGYGRFAFVAGLALGTGRFALHCLSLAPNGSTSEWTDFEKSLEKLPEVARSEIKGLRERRVSDLSPEYLGATLLVQSPILRGAAPALRNIRSPFNLAGQSKELYHFSSLLWLALQIVEHNRALESAKQPLVSWLNQKWLKALGLRERYVLDAAREAATLR